MIKKRLLALVLSTVLLSGVFAGCTQKETASKAPVAGEVSGEASADVKAAKIVWYNGKDDNGAYKALIARFKELQPQIEVELVEFPGSTDDRKKAITASLSAGDTDPDVIEADIIWIPQFSAAGWIMDVTAEVTPTEALHLAGPLAACKIGDKYFAYPTFTDVNLLYYRKDLVKTPPKTWDELVAMSKELTGQGGTEYGFCFQGFQGEAIVCNAGLPFIKSNGGDDVKDGKAIINTPQAVESMNFLKSLIDTGISPKGVLTHKPDDSRAIFEEGKTVFMINWPFAYSVLQNGNNKVAGNVGVTVLPAGPNGTSGVSSLGGWQTTINANTDEPEAAKLFAAFLSSEEGQIIRTLSNSTVPTIKTVFENPEIIEKVPQLADIKGALETARPRPQVPNYPGLSEIMALHFHKILAGEGTAEKNMADLEVELQKALDK